MVASFLYLDSCTSTPSTACTHQLHCTLKAQHHTLDLLNSLYLSSSCSQGGHAPGASLRVASRPPHPAKHALAKPVPPVQGLPKGPVDAIAERIEDPILRTAVKVHQQLPHKLILSHAGILDHDRLTPLTMTVSCRSSRASDLHILSGWVGARR
eukprot:scaffold150847_cov21-Tisochrysis_lutea.AAC.1